MTTPTLYERIGGHAAISAAVPRFYAKAKAHPLLEPYFAYLEDEAMAALEELQIMLLTMVTGGPSTYDGDLREAHAGMNLSDEHVDAVISLLVETLAEMGVHPALIAEVVQHVESARGDVLGRAAPVSS